MSGLFSLIPLIVFLPFIGVIINAFFGRALMPTRESKGPGVIASILAGLSFLIALLMFLALLAHPEGAEVPFLTWINIPAGERTLSIPWTFKVDTLSSVMMLVVTGVGTLIHVYAIGYMHGDIDEQINKRGLDDAAAYDFKRRRFSRFFTYLNLFLGSMLILVTGNNYLMMFVGWELVGLCSYLLIGFWFDDPVNGWSNSKAGTKAFVVNRVGDFGMLMAIFLIFWTFGTLTFNDVFARVECMTEGTQEECLSVTAGASAAEGEEAEHAAGETEQHFAPLTTPISLGFATLPLGTIVTAITLLLLLGATGKSAQIPLFVWLPDAMAGPTPVSALIHAATMVTAGIYMITRSNVLYELAPFSGAAVALIGGATGFVAASMAIAQYDIKKVLAYSTISQLGFMVAAAGVGGYVAAIFHLATHAFFKALLFLGSGSVIHGMEHGHHAVAHGHHGEHHVATDEHGGAAFDPQDMRQMGGLWNRMRLTAVVYIIGALALAGIPPLAGFWSKDEILLDASRENVLVYVLLTIGAFFTAFYMGRQVWMVFFGTPRTEAAGHAHESPPLMTIPLIALAVLSVIGGAMNLPWGRLNFLAQWLSHSVASAHVEVGSGLNYPVAGTSTGLALLAILLSWFAYGRAPLRHVEDRDPLASAGWLFNLLFNFLNARWYWDQFYYATLVEGYQRLARFLADTIDWDFWHNWFHDKVLAVSFRAWADILNRPIDHDVVDGAVNGIAEIISGTSQGMRRVQTGYVRNYALAVALGVVLIVLFLVIRFVL